MKSICVICILLICFLIPSLTACSFPINSRFVDNEGKAATDLLDKIITALQNQDKIGLKVLFSKTVQNEVDLSSGIDYLMTYYQGELSSSDGVSPSSSSNDYGKKITTVEGHYTVKTSIEDYDFYFITETVNTEKLDDIGLIALQIQRVKDLPNNYKWGAYKGPGIYQP